jgi:hypothetical protein
MSGSSETAPTTTAKAVDSMMHHGMGIFPGVLNATTADHLRQYVLRKNQVSAYI